VPRLANEWSPNAKSSFATDSLCISDLRFQTRRQAAWQRNVEHAVRNRITLQHRQALIADLERSINSPPAPEPEPEIIYLSPEEQGPPKRAIRNC